MIKNDLPWKNVQYTIHVFIHGVSSQDVKTLHYIKNNLKNLPDKNTWKVASMPVVL